jgi:phenylacetate-CoA ligase
MYSQFYRQARHFYSGGKILRERLHELEKTQHLTREELKAWQLEKIRQVVKYAYEHVPFYGERYKSLGIEPDDIRSFKDFEGLPFLTREDVNNNLESLVSPELRSIALRNSTGGSTGQPMRFYMENAFSYWDNALELRGRGWYGVHEGDKMAWVWGAAQDMHNWSWKARLKAGLMRERYLNAFDMSHEKILAFARMLAHWKPTIIRAYASALCLLAECIRDNHIQGIHPKVIETTAEKVSTQQRELLESVFQCSVADWYTARELGTIAFQCPQGSLHVAETRYLEVVAKGKPVPAGQLGEVVITSAHQFAMPFIRYKPGDMAIFADQPCSCGRTPPVLEEVVGRLQDFLVNADGHFVHGGYFPHTFRSWPEIVRYQVYQPDMNHLQISLVLRQGGDGLWMQRLREEVQGRFGAEMQIDIKQVDHFELTKAGKHRFIISDIKPDFTGEGTQ